jgi:hypothetical protein
MLKSKANNKLAKNWKEKCFLSIENIDTHQN